MDRLRPRFANSLEHEVCGAKVFHSYSTAGLSRQINN
jgi:hypothetical protein